MTITPAAKQQIRQRANGLYQGQRPIQEARALWVQAGWHPPATDPRH